MQTKQLTSASVIRKNREFHRISATAEFIYHSCESIRFSSRTHQIHFDPSISLAAVRKIVKLKICVRFFTYNNSPRGER